MEGEDPARQLSQDGREGSHESSRDQSADWAFDQSGELPRGNESAICLL